MTQRKNDMKEYLLWLVRRYGYANREIYDILEKYGSARAAYEALAGGEDISDLSRLVERCEKEGIRLVSVGEEDYPPLLARIYCPPAVLFVQGDITCLKNKCLTVVGSRRADNYCMRLCDKICGAVAGRGVTVVSGMAYGIDRTAHLACTRRGFKTVGVLACGINVEYPSRSFELRREITANGGAVLTELLPSVGVDGEYFKARNRILSGLSEGTAVFQAARESGSLITAAYALEENREVFCLPPHDIFDENLAGVIPFLRDGAVSIFDHNDILRSYFPENY